MVAGNHEHYGNDILDTLVFLESLHVKIDNFYFLENDFVVIDDVSFIGATLWSEPNWGVFRQISDAYKISYGRRPLLDSDIKDFCQESRAFIQESLEKIPGKKVVVTHFGPDSSLTHPRWKNDTEINTYFWAKGFEYDIYKADLWLFGHTHDFIDQELDGCRCVCNPHGYVFNAHNIDLAYRENIDYNYDFIIEV